MPGAFGSLFETRLTLTNRGARSIYVDGVNFICQLNPCSPDPLGPQTTIFARPLLYATSASPAHFLFVRREDAPLLAANLRVTDVSHQSETWGMDIPTVKESAALSSSVELLDIPVSADFRTTIRFYDFNPAPGHSLHLKFFDIGPANWAPGSGPADKLLFEMTVPLQAPTETVVGRPGYAQLALGDLPEVQGASRLRVQVTPTDAALRFWTFASITNNATRFPYDDSTVCIAAKRHPEDGGVRGPVWSGVRITPRGPRAP